MVLDVQRSHRAYYGQGERGEGGMEMGKEGGKKEGGRICNYVSLHCQHQNDSCVKTGSDESHFNVSLIVRGKVTRQCPQTTCILFKEKGEPKRN